MTKRFEHEKIYEYLKNFIENELKDTDKIPSENELCNLFNLTRATVRQGIAKLKNEGVIFSKQGSGYFIAPKKINYTLSKNTIFSNEILKIGKKPNIQILEMETVQPDSFLLKKFDLKDKQKLLKVTLTRTADTIPILLGYSYINLNLTPNIDTKIISTTSFTKTFIEYGLEPIRNHSDLEIVPINEKYMKILQTQNSLPLIKIASTSIDKKSGQIIEYVESFFRSDLVKISIDFNQDKEVKSQKN